MLRTLRSQLVVGQVVPLAVVIFILGVVLIYVLETRVILVNLSSQLTSQGALISEMSRDDPGIWRDPARAQAFAERVDDLVSGEIMLLDEDGSVLASSDPADEPLLGQTLTLPGVSFAAAGQRYVEIQYSQDAQSEVADVWIPVRGRGDEVMGAVRLTDRYSTVLDRFLAVRGHITTIMALGLSIGGLAGWWIAVSIARPIQHLTRAVHRLSVGHQLEPLPEEGPEETKLLLHSVNNLVERLRSLEDARRKMLANLVHEIGRPLGAINAAMQALADGAVDDRNLREELFAAVKAELQRLERLLEDLARLHDQVLGMLELRREPTELDLWLETTLRAWREEAQQKGICWSNGVPHTLPTLSIDRDRLAQALGNLLSNAIKYTPPSGEVNVGAGVDEGAVWIRVSDTGQGIPPEEHARIFDSFYRSNHARCFPQGMGLGLTITRELVAAHGGRVEVESAPGEGGTFTIWLPIVR